MGWLFAWITTRAVPYSLGVAPRGGHRTGSRRHSWWHHTCHLDTGQLLRLVIQTKILKSCQGSMNAGGKRSPNVEPVEDYAFLIGHATQKFFSRGSLAGTEIRLTFGYREAAGQGKCVVVRIHSFFLLCGYAHSPAFTPMNTSRKAIF
jgi:hypothetical protein